jgi:hypothetical protein
LHRRCRKPTHAQAGPSRPNRRHFCRPARASIPVGAWADVQDLLPSTAEAATPKSFLSLNVAQQTSILQDACTQLSNGTVVFTCADELAYVNDFSAAYEVAFQALEATNLILNNPDVVQGAVDYTNPGVLASQESLDTIIASALPQSTDGMDEDELRSVDLYPIGVAVVMPSGRSLIPDPLGLARRYKCGHFVRPVPQHAVPFVEGPLQGSSPTGAGADALARTWGRGQGFHDTPGFAGGGMTRPQTFTPALCGLNTYRDHAYPSLFQVRTCSDFDGNPPCTYQARLLIQDYTSSPGGEPNPELWRSGPWPDDEWPAYVYWWHRTR